MKKPEQQSQAPAFCLSMMLNCCHTLLSPWSMAAAVDQGLGGQGEQGTHLSCGETTPGVTPCRACHTPNCSTHSVPRTPLCPFCDPALGMHYSSPWMCGPRATLDTATRLQHSSCSVSTTTATVILCRDFKVFPLKKTKQNKKTPTIQQVVLIRDLCIYKGIVVSFLGQQLAVGALLDHPAVLDHHDDVGCLHGGQAMSNDDAGPTLPGVIQSFLDNLSTENTAILLASEKPSLVLGTTFDFSLSYHLNTCPTDIRVSANRTPLLGRISH